MIVKPEAGTADFSTLQEAPCFTPTHDEFKDPLKYIASIRRDAEPYGICKIRPPKGWKPPFAQHQDVLKFQTKKQDLRTLEGRGRLRLRFEEALRKFMFAIGKPMPSVLKGKITLGAKSVDFFSLHKAVKEFGGARAVAANNYWPEVAAALGHGVHEAEQLAALYCTYLSDLDSACTAHTLLSLLGDGSEDESTAAAAAVAKKKGGGSSSRRGSKAAEDTVVLGQGLWRYFSADKTCLWGVVRKVMAKACIIEYAAGPPVGGCEQPMLGSESLRKSTVINLIANGATRKAAQLAATGEVCEVCSIAAETTKLVVCVSCRSYYHPDCLDPPADKGCCFNVDYFCEDCAKGAEDFRGGGSLEGAASGLLQHGFGEGGMHTLKEFVVAAKRWKADYCKATGLPANPSPAQIEAEFWKLLGPDPPLTDAAPLYGSDLDTSIVGSGFPTLESILAAAAIADSPPRSRRNSNSNSKSSSSSSARSPARAATGTTAATTTGSNYYASPGSKRPRQAHSMSPAQGLQGGWVPSVSPKKEELSTTAAGSGTGEQQEPDVDVYADHDYASDPWNLNLLPLAGSSLLRHLGRRVTGCMVPWLYVGSMFSAFCWHNEDHFLYSINYHHFGAPKRWYGVPGAAAGHFESAMAELLPELVALQPDLLLQLVTMVNPLELAAKGVPVYCATQQPGEFVITFPQAYHAGFNMGPNCAEAVNFAPADWLPYGNGAQERYRDHVRPPVFSHEGLIITLAQWLAATAVSAAGPVKSSKAITNSSSSSNNSNNNSSSSDATSGDESDSPPPPPTTRSAARAAGAAAAAASAAAARTRSSPPRTPLKRGRLPTTSSSSCAANGDTTQDSGNESGYASPGSSTCNSPTLPAAATGSAAAAAAAAAAAVAAVAAAAAEAAATLGRANADGLVSALLVELRTIGNQAAALRASAEAAGCEDFDDMAVFFEQTCRAGSGRRSPGRGSSTGNYSPFKSGSRFGAVKQAGWEAQLTQSGREMGPIDGPRCCVCKQYCYMEIIVCSECSRDRGVGIKRGAVCPRHIESLCDCDADCYTYYERLPEPALEALIQSLQALVVQH